MPHVFGSGPMLFPANHGVIVVTGQCCAFINIFSHVLEWEIARLIWIGFYKNENNDDCFIDQLPKDLITNYIFKFCNIEHI